MTAPEGTEDGRVVLGIHAHLDPATQAQGRSSDRFVDGHAWLSVTRNGKTEFYGLWPDDHPQIRDDKQGWDIRGGREQDFSSDASRYYELTPSQVKELDARLKDNVTWRLTNTCASWASETVKTVTGEKVRAGEFMGATDTPRELINSIRELENTRKTSPQDPLRSDEIKRSSWFGAKHQQACVGLGATPLGTQGAEVLERCANGIAVHAKEAGLQRIDHVVMNRQTPSLQAGENVIAIQGAPGDPTQLRSVSRTEDLLNASPDALAARLQDVQVRQSFEQAQQQTQSQVQSGPVMS